MLAPGDDVSARHATQFGGMLQAGEGTEFLDIDFVSAAGFGIGDVGEPLRLSRNFTELTELQRRECASVVRRIPVPYATSSLAMPRPHFFNPPLLPTLTG